MNAKIISLIIIFIFLVFGGLAFFLFQQNANTPTNTNIGSQNTPVANKNTDTINNNLSLENQNANTSTNNNKIPQNANTAPANTNAAVDTTNWKTYRNTEYGFAAKYPERWYDTGTLSIPSGYTAGDPRIGYIKFGKTFSNENKAPLEMSRDGLWLSVNIYANPQKKTLKQWIDEDSPARGIYAVIQPLTVSGQNAFRTIRDQSIKQVDTEGSYWEEIYISKSGNVYRLIGGTEEGMKESWQKKYQALFNEIVKSFSLSL